MFGKDKTVGVLVMNREKARFFYFEKVHLSEIEDFISEKTMLSDFWESKGGLGDKDNKIVEHELEVFAKHVCEKIYQTYQNKSFDEFLVIASDKVPHEISRHLHTDILGKKRIVDENIVNFSLAQIEGRVKEIERKGIEKE